MMSKLVPYEPHRFVDVCKKGFGPCAQIIRPRLSRWRSDEAIFRAATVMHEPHFARTDVFGQRIALRHSKRPLLIADSDLRQRNIDDVPDLMSRFDEMIGPVNIAVLFYRTGFAAGFFEPVHTGAR